MAGDQSVESYIADWTRSLTDALGDRIVGAYLTGSLTYGDFIEGRSDIDLAVVVETPLNAQEIAAIRTIHIQLEETHSIWRERVECSYIPLALLPSVLPPETPRPWWGFGVLYETAPYGNEWIINQYFLWKCSVTLAGVPFKSLVEHVDIEDVRAACVRDLHAEWAPKLNDPEWLGNSHYQSYLVLNLCRIMYTVCCSEAGSKTTASEWVKQQFPQWQELITEAQLWTVGTEMNRQESACEFLQFVLSYSLLSGTAFSAASNPMRL